MSDDQSEDVLAIDPVQYKRLYDKLLKKHQEKQRLIELNEKNDRQNKRSKRNKRDKDNSDSDSQNKRRPRVRDRSRSRQKVQQQQINWHMYEEIPAIDYIDQLPQKLRHLPIFKKKDEILQKIMKNQIILVTGDTGCGKSTQVPRLIYEYLKRIESSDKIICVQPRRLAVTSLKTAVQSQLSSYERVVGYQIGQKAEFNSNSRIVFMTNGIFLQRIIHDTTFLNEYPFVVLDQVHERDIDTDFILTALKRIIRQYPKVRIILMSATIDNELFRYYFASDHIDTFMTEDNFYKKIIQMQQYQKVHDDQQSEQQEGFTQRQQDSEQEQERKKKIYDNVAFKFLQSKFPCPAVNINQPSNFKRTYYYLDTLDNFVLREYVKKWGSIIWSHKHANTYKELFQMGSIIIDQIRYNSRQKSDLSSQGVLVFLPGLNEIENFSESLFAFLGGREKVHQYFQLIHVHSTIMNEKVEKKISTPNKRQIKVIISTNIAQSSITVKGVKYVIDFCLTKEIRFDEKSKMENLQLVWSSKASCKQRAGRTGRVCDGYIFRLVEEKFYLDKFDDYSEPEIKRSSLDKLILRIKMMHENDRSDLFRDPPEVLGTCIQPPRLESIQSAINSLKFCGGLQQRGDQFFITDLGKLYVQLPIDITYTKLLIISILFGTFNDILILVAILSQNKNPVHKREIQNNSLKYLNQVSNYQYCDFLALINMFKNQQQFRKQLRHTTTTKKQQQQYSINNSSRKDRNKSQRQYIRQQHRLKDRLPFSIYTQTKNTIEDIMKRMQRKWFNFSQLSSYLDYRNGADTMKLSLKCHQQHSQKLKYTDYYMRFKMTLAFGFVDKLILVKTPMHDNKQQKRIRDMKRFNISNENTIVLLNSSVITKLPNHNRQAEEKFVKHWQDVFRKSLNINVKGITITAGLNYLHFEQEIDLNKLSFIKYMDTNSKRRSSASCILDDPSKKQHRQQQKSSAYLTTKQILQCLGDLDHMQQGIPVTLFKQHRIIIDSHSVNRVCNLNENAMDKYLITNSFMLQNKNSLSCRYTSVLNIFSFDCKKIPNTILPVLTNLLFYPFVKLKVNKKQTQYQYLALKKRYLIKIPYHLTSQQIEQANFIRQLIKEFLQLKRPLTSQTCADFYQLIRKFICRKRRDTVHAKDEEIWQTQFLNQLKDGKIPNAKELRIFESVNNQKTQSKQEKKYIITEEAEQNINNSPKDQNAMTFQELRNTLRQETPSFETRNFMNPIELPKISAQTSYFLRPRNQSSEHFKKRIEFYLKWKLSKLHQAQEMTKYAQDNDTYLCCGYKMEDSDQCCSIPLCKLKRVGALDEEEIFRDLFEPMMENLVQSTEQGSQVDDFLYGQNFQSQYTKFSCKNGHQIGIRLKGEVKLKIIILKHYAIKYPDYPYGSIQEADFSSLDMKDWAKEQRQAIERKQKKLLSTSCYLCAIKISTFKELKSHVQDTYHAQTVQKFRKSLQSTRMQLQNESKLQQIDDQQQEELSKKQFDKLKSLKHQQKIKQDDDAMEIQY